MDPIYVALLWLAAASLVGFMASFIYASWLEYPRRLFLVPYLFLSSFRQGDFRTGVPDVYNNKGQVIMSV